MVLHLHYFFLLNIFYVFSLHDDLYTDENLNYIRALSQHVPICSIYEHKSMYAPPAPPDLLAPPQKLARLLERRQQLTDHLVFYGGHVPRSQNVRMAENLHFVGQNSRNYPAGFSNYSPDEAPPLAPTFYQRHISRQNKNNANLPESLNFDVKTQRTVENLNYGGHNQHGSNFQDFADSDDQSSAKNSKSLNIGGKIQKMARNSSFSASFDQNSMKSQRITKNSKNSNSDVKNPKASESSHFGVKNVEKFTKWLPDLQLKRARSQSLPAAADGEALESKGFVKKKKRQLAATVKSIARVYRRHSVAQARHQQQESVRNL